MNRSCLRSYVAETKSLELRVSMAVRYRSHSVAIGLPNGEVLEEFEIAHATRYVQRTMSGHSK
jgi:hypothetical protein